MASESEARLILDELLTDPRIRASLSRTRNGHGCHGGWRVHVHHATLGRWLWVNSLEEWAGVRVMWRACGCWDGQQEEEEAEAE